MFLELIKDLLYGFHIWLALILGIDQHIVQIYNNKKVELLSKDFIDVTLKTSQNVEESEKHDLVFKMVILGSKSCFLFIIFLNSYLVIAISLV